GIVTAAKSATSESQSSAGSSGQTTAGAKTQQKSEAPGKADPTARAYELVQEALFREVYGASDDRNRLLTEARSIAPNYPPALWHSGQVELDKHWVKIDDVPQLAGKNSQLSVYEAKREKTSDTLAGQLNLAQWCQKHGLPQQAVAHYGNVLLFDPDNRTARSQLGFRRFGSSWLTKSALDERTARAQELAAELNKWVPKVAGILNDLCSGQQQSADAAKKQLAEIDDLQSIPALEFVLSESSEESALML